MYIASFCFFLLKPSWSKRNLFFLFSLLYVCFITCSREIRMDFNAEGSKILCFLLSPSLSSSCYFKPSSSETLQTMVVYICWPKLCINFQADCSVFCFFTLFCLRVSSWVWRFQEWIAGEGNGCTVWEQCCLLGFFFPDSQVFLVLSLWTIDP